MKAPNASVNSWPQRLAVLGAVLAAVLGFTMPPDGQEPAEVAHARYQCGPNDSNRANLETASGDTIRPCVSKVNLQVQVPVNGNEKRVEIDGVQRDPGFSTADIGNLPQLLPTDPDALTDALAQLGIDAPIIDDLLGDGTVDEQLLNDALDQLLQDFVDDGQLHTMKYADGSTEQLYRLTFENLRFLEDVTLQTTNGQGKQVRIKPDRVPGLDRVEAQLGGRGSDGRQIYTDLWVTPESVINMDLAGINPLQIDDPLLQPLLSELAGVSCDDDTQVQNPLLGITGIVPLDVRICGLDLEVRFLTTTAGTGDLQGAYAVKLPNTTLSLEPGGPGPRQRARGSAGGSGGGARASDLIDSRSFFTAVVTGRVRPSQEDEDNSRTVQQQQPGAQTFSPSQQPETDDAPSGDGGLVPPGTSGGTTGGGGSTAGGSTDGGAGSSTDSGTSGDSGTSDGSGDGDSGSDDCGFSLFGAGC